MVKITRWNPHNPVDVRKNTNRLLEMIDEQLLDPRDVVMMCVKWMSEDEVTEMCRVNEVFYDEEDEDDDDN